MKGLWIWGNPHPKPRQVGCWKLARIMVHYRPVQSKNHQACKHYRLGGTHDILIESHCYNKSLETAFTWPVPTRLTRNVPLHWLVNRNPCGAWSKSWCKDVFFHKCQPGWSDHWSVPYSRIPLPKHHLWIFANRCIQLDGQAGWMETQPFWGEVFLRPWCAERISSNSKLLPIAMKLSNLCSGCWRSSKVMLPQLMHCQIWMTSSSSETACMAYGQRHKL